MCGVFLDSSIYRSHTKWSNIWCTQCSRRPNTAAQRLSNFYPHFATGSTKILPPRTFARHILRDITLHLQIMMFDWEIVLKRKLMSGHLRLPRVVNRVDQSGIIVVPTCHVSFWMATPNIHHSVQALTRCVDHRALQWLRINGFRMIGDLQRFLSYLHECLKRLSLGQNNWPIACNKWALKNTPFTFYCTGNIPSQKLSRSFPDHSFSFLGTPGQTRAFAALSRGSRGGVHLYRRMDTWAFPPLLRSFRKPFEKFSYIYIIYTIECHSLMAPPTTCFKYKCLQLSPKQMRKQESCQNLPVTFRNIPLSCSFTAVHKQKRHITHL